MYAEDLLLFNLHDRMSSYEDESSWPWYHQSLSRMDGEQLLVESNKDGAFLVRGSDTVKGAYVLSIMLVKL